jgi:hypothetical protein
MRNVPNWVAVSGLFVVLILGMIVGAFFEHWLVLN